MMTSSLFLKASESRARQRSIVSHHGLSAPLSTLAVARHSRTMSSSTRPTSPRMAMSARTFLLSDDGSMSTWIFLEWGEKASSRPVMRSSKRAPRHTITSQSCMAMLAS